MDDETFDDMIRYAVERANRLNVDEPPFVLPDGFGKANPERFQAAMKDVSLYSVPAIANNLGVTPATVEGWMFGEIPFPGWVHNLIVAIERARRAEARATDWQRRYEALECKLKAIREFLESV